MEKQLRYRESLDRLIHHLKRPLLESGLLNPTGRLQNEEREANIHFMRGFYERAVGALTSLRDKSLQELTDSDLLTLAMPIDEVVEIRRALVKMDGMLFRVADKLKPKEDYLALSNCGLAQFKQFQRDNKNALMIELKSRNLELGTLSRVTPIGI